MLLEVTARALAEWMAPSNRAMLLSETTQPAWVEPGNASQHALLLGIVRAMMAPGMGQAFVALLHH